MHLLALAYHAHTPYIHMHTHMEYKRFEIYEFMEFNRFQLPLKQSTMTIYTDTYSENMRYFPTQFLRRLNEERKKEKRK